MLLPTGGETLVNSTTTTGNQTTVTQGTPNTAAASKVGQYSVR